eukprot:TRINITY_DN2570_c0_g1_i2.p1 TRINITY_DN2570_c0_g1~~TRINITY_DN2570_c0_g1_i2.p1  ORF type:complete len:436 (+),score=89.39 TRINITY_DN2570_c0_g1_i2:89-1396(+)
MAQKLTSSSTLNKVKSDQNSAQVSKQADDLEYNELDSKRILIRKIPEWMKIPPDDPPPKRPISPRAQNAVAPVSPRSPSATKSSTSTTPTHPISPRGINQPQPQESDDDFNENISPIRKAAVTGTSALETFSMVRNRKGTRRAGEAGGFKQQEIAKLLEEAAQTYEQVEILVDTLVEIGDISFGDLNKKYKSKFVSLPYTLKYARQNNILVYNKNADLLAEGTHDSLPIILQETDKKVIAVRCAVKTSKSDISTPVSSTSTQWSSKGVVSPREPRGLTQSQKVSTPESRSNVAALVSPRSVKRSNTEISDPVDKTSSSSDSLSQREKSMNKFNTLSNSSTTNSTSTRDKSTNSTQPKKLNSPSPNKTETSGKVSPVREVAQSEPRGNSSEDSAAKLKEARQQELESIKLARLESQRKDKEEKKTVNEDRYVFTCR